MTHPRPDRARPDWLDLNGEWGFAPDPASEWTGPPTGWPESIVVPFGWETSASTVERTWLETGWYHRRIAVPEGWRQRVVLCFGAAHQLATVWVNGQRVGEHAGGTTPFEFDITDAAGSAEAELVVRVHAPNDKQNIVHGKQRSIPRDDYDGVSFTPTSGLWQSVWLESRPATQLAAVELRPTEQLDGLNARVRVAGPPAAGVRLTVDGTIVEAEPGDDGWRASIPLAEPRVWSPDDPHLYDVLVEVRGPDGVDEVSSYTGLRRVDTDGDRLLLNGRPLYLRAVLDQGYWPGTGLTPPDDDALRRDLELARELGYNCVRKHLKLEDPRWLYWADRLGLLVWAEPAATSRYSPESVAAFEAQVPAMVERDGNHPCIVVWGLYNEEWGLDWDVPGDPAKQDALRRAYDLLTALDDSRPVVDNSGWTHVRTDLLDWHVYDNDPGSWARTVQGLVDGSLDSFPVQLGPDYVVPKALVAGGNDDMRGLPFLNSEYGGGSTSVERAWHLRWQTQELRRHDRIVGYVYTELYDIEHETAGLLAFDRSGKDLAGLDPADVNAATVFVFDLTPQAPGADLVCDDDGLVRVPVRISHHGAEPVSGRIRAAWAPALAPFPAEPADAVASEPIEAKPFELSAPVDLTCRMPAGLRSARLLFWLDNGSGVRARAFLDVTTA